MFLRYEFNSEVTLQREGQNWTTILWAAMKPFILHLRARIFR